MNRIIKLKNQASVKRINDGNPWIYSNELVDLPDIENGSLVKVVDNKQNDYGLGFYNRNSLFAVRLLFVKEVNLELIKSRISNAIMIREDRN